MKSAYTRSTSKATSTCKSGFQRLKPSLDNVGLVPPKANKKLTSAFKEHIINDGPYRFMITITFRHRLSLSDCLSFLNNFIHYYNRKHFGGKYLRQNKFVKGYAFIEKHKMGNSNNEIHLHLLIIDHAKFDKFEFLQHRDIFIKAISKVKDYKNKDVFDTNCVHIREVSDDGAIDYCFKELWDKNLNKIKPIGKRGVSDYC